MDWQRIALMVVLAACGGGKSAEPGTDSFKRALLDFSGHVIVMKATSPFTEYRDVAARVLKVPGVTSAEPFVFSEVMVKVGGKDEPIGLKGIDMARTPLAGRITPRNALDGHVPSLPAGSAAVGPGPSDVVDPAPDDFSGPGPSDVVDYSGRARPPDSLPTIHVAMGVALARRLGVKVGGTAEILVPAQPNFDSWQHDPQPAPQPRLVRVVALLETTAEYDERTVLTTLAAAQSLFGRGDSVMGLELRVTKIDDAPRLAREINADLGLPYHVLDWCELNKNALRC